ncbi:SpoIID/LytB domain-containing protein [Faecalicatena sp. Marseille-Q4148]|nr:SpoIID/LytB domain-containing protein [Faecalicatena sp. Marseille-Q4148]
MKFKEQYIYYGLCAVTAMLLIVAVINKREMKQDQLRETKKQEQSQEQKKAEEKDVGNAVIRVLIRGEGFQEELHEKVGITAPGGLVIEYGGGREELEAQAVFEAVADHPYFASGAIRISPRQPGEKLTVTTLTRGYGVPSYGGIIELVANGGVAVINEIPFEEYLYGVVPSEMPASYEMEALKCQAVCARSYAYHQMQEMAYPQYQAQVDDSTAFQVYGNSEIQPSVIQAVDETAGQKLWYQGQVAAAYYYSTSCGMSTDMTAWGGSAGEETAYLKSISISGEQGDYEKELPWYRWEAAIPKTVISDLISEYVEADIGNLTRLEVTERGAGGVALVLVAEGDRGSAVIETENKIRRALGGSGYEIMKQDGNLTPARDLLPSAFFEIEEQPEQIILHGGGFGHGIGMSQNGANEMAKQGMEYEEILKTFYCGVTIE